MAKTDEEMAEHIAKVDQSMLGGGSAGWKAGDIMYADLDGDGKITNGASTLDDPGDRTVIGNSTPRFRFGLNIGAEFRTEHRRRMEGHRLQRILPGRGQTGLLAGRHDLLGYQR